ncbi:MAG: hypothetical protein ACYCXW_10430, partial [Solirubrobacteraceae bacterium]
MTQERDPDQPQLARLADDSLPAAEREQLRLRVEGSPPLAETYAEQQRALTLLRAFDEPAPAQLRAAVLPAGRSQAGRGAPAARRRPALALRLVAGVAL